MASGTDYVQEYGQAEKAYLQGKYEEAAAIIDRLIEHFPEDPSARLLRGHIYCYGLQQYDIAREQYELVLNLTDQSDFIDYATNGLEYTNQFHNGDGSPEMSLPAQNFEADYHELDETNGLHEDSTFQTWQQEDEPINFDLGSLDFEDGESDEFASPTSATPFANPFDDSSLDYEATDQAFQEDDSPFGFAPELAAEGDEFDTSETESSYDFGLDTDVFEDDLSHTEDDFFADASPDETSATFVIPSNTGFDPEPSYEEISEPFDTPSHFNDFPQQEIDESPYGSPEGDDDESYNSTYPTFADETFLMDSGEMDDDFTTDRENLDYASQGGIDATEALQDSPYLPDDDLDEPHYDQNGFNSQEQFDFVSFDEAFGNDSFEVDEVTEPQEGSFSGIESRHSAREGFLDEFDVFDDDLGAIPDFSLDDREDLSREGPDESDFDLLSNGGGVPGASSGIRLNDSSGSLTSEDEMFSISTPSEQIPVFSQPKETDSEPIVNVEQGWLAPFENAALKQKQWLTAIASGVVSAVMVALVSFISASMTSSEEKPTVVDHLRKTSGLMTLAAGLAGFGTTWALGRITTRQIHRATTDLQKQFDAISQGNLNATATIYSEDEFGQLAAGFNQMARVILTTTSEAQRKAEEQEQAKEDLQRQVIRLLDDVEGAARGDLTVQAEVTADVLGAVADSFNLTIQNLREIVQQVKQAARQVNKGASDSEIFARSLSSDALRQAEELAVTLNSVQVMTDLIGRVAESAKEAEDVARSASATALKGGDAVERTVAGILQIRETVAETTRKVKRLAESSQEISKIVALISQIASRTNLLALNASIEAARAGEAGRGFAIVADEVRQLADRAAKALKEIEQIVLQIQSETSSVMTAMEEGTQQVIDGTRRAEQAKRSLEDIVQVSNRIDALVRSIAADTVEQTETSRAVAQVMQSVELTAQETSQEAQRVSGALQNLVGVARDLLTSVERFRVESNGGK